MRVPRIFAAACLCAQAALAQRVGSPTDDLDKLSVDELFTVQVTSVGRKAQQLSKAPAAVFVLTAEDIRRSGATSIPEALQWAPGLTVLHLDGRSWIVSARGSIRLYADKILVMIDGRSLYTPLFSGVIWDAINVPMEDIDRIEVVRGPGAVMWGPNAVNGVINIITRRAQSTKGASISTAAGNELRGTVEARWDAAPSEKIAYRTWGEYAYRAPAYGSPGYFGSPNYADPAIRNLDEAHGRFGFRIDGQPSERDQWTVQGDIYRVDRQDAIAYPGLHPAVDRVRGRTDYEGGYLQGRWTHASSDGGESTFQFSYDRNQWDYPFIGASLANLTLDFQKRLQTGERNEVYWGVGYQQYGDDAYSGRYIGFDPLQSTYRTGYGVIRDEFQIVPSRLMASAGIRLDSNNHSHLDFQPSFRVLYTPSNSESLWVAVSRAVRTPSRVDRDLRCDCGYIESGAIPIHLLVQGSTQMHSEIEKSVEAGYRYQQGQRWSIDTSLFWSYYTQLRATQSPLVPQVSFSGTVPTLTLLTTLNNDGTGRTFGGEIWSTGQVSSSWRITPSYSYAKETRWLPAVPGARIGWDRHPSDLRHQGILRSQFDLPGRLQLDVMAKARSRDLGVQIPGALLFDARLAWRPTRSAEISLTVDNIAGRHVVEGLGEAGMPAIPIRRTFVLRLTYRL